MRRGLPQFIAAKRAPEGNRVSDPDIDRWENEGGSVGKRGLVAKPGKVTPLGMRL